MNKHCTHCKTETNLMESPYSIHTNKIGVLFEYYMCRECNAERHSKYRLTDTGKENVNRTIRKYQSKNKDKVRVWDRVHRIEPLIAEKKCNDCFAIATISTSS